MARASRIAVWRDRWGSVWLSATVTMFLAVAAACAPWTADQRALGDWRTPDREIRWLPARTVLLPRYPAEGEEPRRLATLPFGGETAVQISLDFQATPEVGDTLSLLVPSPDGRVRVFVNGVPLPERRTAVEGDSRLSFTPPSVLMSIPGNHLHPGQNRLDMIVTDARVRPLASPVYVGPTARLSAAIQPRTMMTALLRELLLGAAVLVMAVNLLAAALRARPCSLPLAATFALIGVAIFLKATGTDARLGSFGLLIERLLLTAAMVSAGLALLAQARAPSSRSRSVESRLLIVTALTALTSLLATWRGVPIAVAGGPALVTLGLTWLAWCLWRGAPAVVDRPMSSRVLAGAVFGLAGVAAFTAVVGALGLTPATPPFAPQILMAGSLSALALVALAKGGREAWREAAARMDAWFDQSRTIARQQEVLDATTRALDRQSRQSAALEERQRMARDVHDGIGGQLASLIAQVRLRRIDMDDVEKALVGGLSELRLLVDSLDMTGETLADALSTFVERARQQTAAAGIALQWLQDDHLAAEIRDPKWILNLYRLMQEAITNAVRHSGGDVICVEIGSAGEGRLVVRVRDNGTAFDLATARSGRGLANMAHRARELGGRFSVGRDPDRSGTLVEVDLPVPDQTVSPTER